MSAFLNPLFQDTPAVSAGRLPLVPFPFDSQSATYLDQNKEAWSRPSPAFRAAGPLPPPGLDQGRLGDAAAPTGLFVPDEPVCQAPQDTTSPEMDWLSANADMLGQYCGEWLLIVGAGLAAHSADFAEIRRVVTAREIESPFIYYVPTREESNFVAI